MLTIGPYQPGDGDRMVEIAPQAFGVWARYGIDRTLPRDRVQQLYRDEARGYAQRAEARDPSLAVFVARAERGVVGYIVVGTDEALGRAFGFTWGRIISLAVDPPSHGHGIGPQLVRAGMEWLRAQQCGTVEVWTDLNNIAAIRTYEGAGFRVIYSGVALSQVLGEPQA
jgi:ribosomal protein S18 acetylase RimI-like enzyme